MVWPIRRLPERPAVSHAAVVENKRLGQVLRTVKAQQDVPHVPTVQTNSSKLGYKKHPRQLYGPDYVAKTEEKSPEPKAVEICKIAKSGDFTHSHSTTATALY